MKSIFGKILTYLGGFVVVSTLCVAGITAFFVSDAVTQDENQIIQDDNKQSISYIQNYFDKYIYIMQQMARDKNVINMLSNDMNQDTYQQSPYYEDVYSMLKATESANNEILTTYIAKCTSGNASDFAFDNEGWTSDISYSLAKKEYGFTKKEDIEKGFIICQPYLDTDNNQMVTTISAPVYDKTQSKIVGVAAVDFKVSTVCNIVTSAQSTFESGYRILVSDDGYILAHPNQDYLLKNYKEIGLDEALVSNITEVSQGIVPFKDAECDSVAVIGQEQNSGWKVVNIVPKSEYKETTNRIIQILFLINLISVLVLFFMMIVITKGICNSLNKLTKITDQISSGDLDVSIDVHSNDEIGRLADFLTVLTGKLKMYIVYINEISELLTQMGNGNLNLTFEETYNGNFKRIKDAFILATDKLSNALIQINGAADQVAGGSNQVSAGAQALAQGASEQASSIEELSATVEKISKQISRNAENAQLVREESASVGNEVNNCNEHMQQMITAMKDINAKSIEISKIIKTIESIAFQTNILALNAAVEAARAGSAGKGFAVVADEVRNLAHKSNDAANNTTILIEETVQSVQSGVEIAKSTAQSLLNVVKDSGKVIDLINEIADASNEQATAVTQVTIGIDQISTVVQTNSATAEESAAASEELSSQSQMLKYHVNQFQLKTASSDEIAAPANPSANPPVNPAPSNADPEPALNKY